MRKVAILKCKGYVTDADGYDKNINHFVNATDFDEVDDDTYRKLWDFCRRKSKHNYRTGEFEMYVLIEKYEEPVSKTIAEYTEMVENEKKLEAKRKKEYEKQKKLEAKKKKEAKEAKERKKLEELKKKYG